MGIFFLFLIASTTVFITTVDGQKKKQRYNERAEFFETGMFNYQPPPPNIYGQPQNEESSQSADLPSAKRMRSEHPAQQGTPLPPTYPKQPARPIQTSQGIPLTQAKRHALPRQTGRGISMQQASSPQSLSSNQASSRQEYRDQSHCRMQGNEQYGKTFIDFRTFKAVDAPSFAKSHPSASSSVRPCTAAEMAAAGVRPANQGLIIERRPVTLSERFELRGFRNPSPPPPPQPPPGPVSPHSPELAPLPEEYRSDVFY